MSAYRTTGSLVHSSCRNPRICETGRALLTSPIRTREGGRGSISPRNSISLRVAWSFSDRTIRRSTLDNAQELLLHFSHQWEQFNKKLAVRPFNNSGPARRWQVFPPACGFVSHKRGPIIRTVFSSSRPANHEGALVHEQCKFFNSRRPVLNEPIKRQLQRP